MKSLSRIALFFAGISLSIIPLLGACGGGDDGGTASPTKTGPSPTARAVITIGNHTDLTGYAAVAMEMVNAGFEDTVRYYNENNLIEGVQVKVLNYDGQLDPAKDRPGWEWLKEKGSQTIVAWFPSIGITLQPLAEKDRIPLFIANAPSELIQTPGYLFLTSPRFEDAIWTLLEWVMANDWDYSSKGPARIGMAADQGGNPTVISSVFEKYARMYPERINWVGAQVVPTGTYNWQTAVEALKDCDYIYPPNIVPLFLKDYVFAGYSKARFIGIDSHMTWFSILEDMGLWPKINGMLFLTQSEWWGEDAEYQNLVAELITRYRSGSLKEIEKNPKGYNSVANAMMVLESIKNAAQAVGPENITPVAIYEGAQSMKLTFDGVRRFSFTETKRSAPDRMAIYQADGTNKRCVRVSEWFPLITAP